jgi:hypothetical protein
VEDVAAVVAVAAANKLLSNRLLNPERQAQKRRRRHHRNLAVEAAVAGLAGEVADLVFPLASIPSKFRLEGRTPRLHCEFRRTHEYRFLTQTERSGLTR